MSDVPAVLVFLYCSRVYSLGLHNLTPEPRKKKKKKVLHWTWKSNWVKATEIMAFVQLQRCFPQRNMEIQRNNKMFSTVCVFAVHLEACEIIHGIFL